MYAETDEELRSEADQLLDSGLRQILTDYGEVHVIGSYTLHLMAWRDLDIHIVRKGVDPVRFFDLGGRIATLLKPHRMHYRDETVAATPGLPKGLYWGVYLGDERDGAWKIDIGVSEPEIFESTRAYGGQIAARLLSLLGLQFSGSSPACWRHPEYRRGFSSSDIYTAVLEHGATSIDGFWSFLKERNCAV